MKKPKQNNYCHNCKHYTPTEEVDIGKCWHCETMVLGSGKNRKCFKARTPCANCKGLSQYNLGSNADVPGENVVEISCVTCANKEAKK